MEYENEEVENMNALHKSLNLSSLCLSSDLQLRRLIYGGGGGVWNATWNISLRGNLEKQNNTNKQQKERKKMGSTLKEHFFPLLFC